MSVHVLQVCRCGGNTVTREESGEGKRRKPRLPRQCAWGVGGARERALLHVKHKN